MDTTGPPGAVVIVGSGLAGLRTAAELRERGFAGWITVLGSEGVDPYDRPPLSKHLLTADRPELLADSLGLAVSDLGDEAILDDAAISLSVSSAGVSVHTASGRDHHASALVLACGSTPVRPWPAALALHTWDDAERLRARLPPGSRLVIIGAGWIGAEVAGLAAAAGVRVTVVEGLEAPLSRQLGAEIGALTAPWYAEAGVDLRTGVRVEEVEREGEEVLVRVSGSQGASSQSLTADVVLAAVGVRPATSWLRDVVALNPTGHVPVDADGLVRDAALAARRIWAVGDCAVRTTSRFGEIPGGHWTAAMEDPARVAASILRAQGEGASAPDDASKADVQLAESPPYVFSTQFGRELAVLGSLLPSARIMLRGEPSGSAGWTALALDSPDDGATARLAGAFVVDRPRDVAQARRLLSSAGPALLDVSRATDPAIPLRSAVASP